MRDRIPPIEEMEETYGEQMLEEPDIDWKDLFFKYVDHVGKEEGVDFLNSQEHWIPGTYNSEEEWIEGHSVKWCTDEEWAAILRASDEI
jgi:hypothetical protein